MVDSHCDNQEAMDAFALEKILDGVDDDPLKKEPGNCCDRF